VDAHMISLCSVDWFKDVYVKIYNILALDNRLQPPDNIYLLDDKEAFEMFNVADTVQGFAVTINGKKCVWFRHIPPDPIVFAHELIHLCDKSNDVHEEVYGYNLASLIVMLARENIVPEKNPLMLFETVTIDDLLRTLRDVYGYPFRDICEYFIFIGSIPQFIDLDLDLKTGEFVGKINPSYDQKAITVLAISDIIAGAQYDQYMFNVILKLLGVRHDNL
jgi:hypothetical protein